MIPTWGFAFSRIRLRFAIKAPFDFSFDGMCERIRPPKEDLFAGVSLIWRMKVPVRLMDGRAGKSVGEASSQT